MTERLVKDKNHSKIEDSRLVDKAFEKRENSNS
jgi:hypothetical protein